MTYLSEKKSVKKKISKCPEKNKPEGLLLFYESEEITIMT